MHHRSFIEVGEFSHIVGLIKLCWIDFIDIIGVNISFLFKLVRPAQIESSQV